MSRTSPSALLLMLAPLVMLLGSGCASDPYRPFDDGIGYSEVELAPGLWQVFYEGPRRMSYGQAVEFAKVRAAEIAQREGRPYFEIIDTTSSSRTETEVYRDFHPGARLGYRRGYGPHVGAYYETYTDIYQRPAGVLRVRLLDEPTDTSLDAQRVLEQARERGVLAPEE